MTPDIFSCEHCNGRLGVYEPVVLIEDDEVRDTSRAAEPDLGPEAGLWYHSACFAEVSFVATAATPAGC